MLSKQLQSLLFMKQILRIEKQIKRLKSGDGSGTSAQKAAIKDSTLFVIRYLRRYKRKAYSHLQSIYDPAGYTKSNLARDIAILKSSNIGDKNNMPWWALADLEEFLATQYTLHKKKNIEELWTMAKEARQKGNIVKHIEISIQLYEHLMIHRKDNGVKRVLPKNKEEKIKLALIESIMKERKYCRTCNKLVCKSVYKYHLSGRRHNNNSIAQKHKLHSFDIRKVSDLLEKVEWMYYNSKEETKENKNCYIYCEVCDDKFGDRMDFYEHFDGNKHIEALYERGIADPKKFKGIYTIKYLDKVSVGCRYRAR